MKIIRKQIQRLNIKVDNILALSYKGNFIPCLSCHKHRRPSLLWLPGFCQDQIKKNHNFVFPPKKQRWEWTESHEMIVFHNMPRRLRLHVHAKLACIGAVFLEYVWQRNQLNILLTHICLHNFPEWKTFI